MYTHNLTLIEFSSNNMKYWQKIRVTSWFYEGMEVIALREEPIIKNSMIETVMIKVKLKEIDIWYFSINFPESSLELIK